jgi:hypothetical protein
VASSGPAARRPRLRPVSITRLPDEMPKTVWPGREAHATDPEVLTPRAVATPDPDPGEVRIAVDSSGVNFADCMARIGIYEKTPELPAVIRWEVAW